MKNTIINTFKFIDENIKPSQFKNDWHQARNVIHQMSVCDDQSATSQKWMTGSLKPVALTVSIMALGLTVAILIQSDSRENTDDPVDEIVLQSDQRISLIDPNRPWYAPTDDLLQVSVLGYQDQWMTFTEYNPITMEIR